MAVLPVRTALAYLDEAEPFESSRDLARLEDGNGPHPSSDLDGLSPDVLGFEPGLAIFEQHRDDLGEVGAKLVERGSLRVCARPPRHIADEQPCIGLAFDHGGVLAHGWIVARRPRSSALRKAPPP